MKLAVPLLPIVEEAFWLVPNWSTIDVMFCKVEVAVYCCCRLRSAEISLPRSLAFVCFYTLRGPASTTTLSSCLGVRLTYIPIATAAFSAPSVSTFRHASLSLLLIVQSGFRAFIVQATARATKPLASVLRFIHVCVDYVHFRERARRGRPCPIHALKRVNTMHGGVRPWKAGRTCSFVRVCRSRLFDRPMRMHNCRTSYPSSSRYVRVLVLYFSVWLIKTSRTRLLRTNRISFTDLPIAIAESYLSFG